MWLLAVGMMRDGEKTISYIKLADALGQLRPERDWRLVVVGDGPNRDVIQETLQAATMGRVIFAGERNDSDLAKFYAASDCMVWPAHGEAFGMAMLEAQASGLPVVACNTGGVPAVVEDGLSGTLVRANDASAFANAIDVLIQDDGRRASYSSAAHIRVRDKQSLEAASLRLETILSRIGIL
jgi:glycosyltransferase involved in cell wall biosynthesis